MLNTFQQFVCTRMFVLNLKREKIEHMFGKIIELTLENNLKLGFDQNAQYNFSICVNNQIKV